MSRRGRRAARPSGGCVAAPPASRQGRSLAAAGGTRSRVRPPFCEPLAPGSGWLGTRREQPLEQEAVCGHHFVSPCFALKAVHHGPPSHLWLVDELTYGILGNMLVWSDVCLAVTVWTWPGEPEHPPRSLRAAVGGHLLRRDSHTAQAGPSLSVPAQRRAGTVPFIDRPSYCPPSSWHAVTLINSAGKF